MSVLANESFRQHKPRGLSALFGSYAADLRGWATHLAAGYGIAAALLLGGVLAVFGAIAVGAMALFHVIELRYGTNIAFAALGGGLLALAVILFLAGWLLLKRGAPPLPRPREQVRAAKQMLISSTIARGVATLRANEAARPDTTTQILLGSAAIIAMGWLAASRLGSGRRGSQLPR